MSYPYGQPPQQPGYPAPAQHAPGYAAPAYPAPGYPAPAYPGQGYPAPMGYQAAPGGGTGITAGILALLGGVASTFSAIGMFILAAATSDNSLTSGAVLATGARRRSSSSSSSSSGPDIDFDFDLGGIGVVLGIAYSVLALLLLIGGILLLRRSNTGRVLVIVGCVASIVLTVAVLASASTGGFNVFSAPVFAVVTLVLAAIAPTKRWIEAARMPAMAGGYGAAPYGYR